MITLFLVLVAAIISSYVIIAIGEYLIQLVIDYFRLKRAKKRIGDRN